jgi:hypothetical protein
MLNAHTYSSFFSHAQLFGSNPFPRKIFYVIKPVIIKSTEFSAFRELKSGVIKNVPVKYDRTITLRNLCIIKKHPQSNADLKKEKFMWCDFTDFHHPS